MRTPFVRVQSPPSTGTFTSPLTLGAILALASCNVPGDSVRKGTIHVDATIADSFDVEASGFGFTANEEADYESLQVSAGVTFLAPDPNGMKETGHRLSRVEVSLGSASVSDFDVLEFSVGGRVFFTDHQQIQPFLSAGAVLAHIDDIDGFEPGTQFGMRVGGGVEFALSDFIFLDASVDYTLPLLAAESDPDPVFGEFIQSELSGLALRVGIGVVF